MSFGNFVAIINTDGTVDFIAEQGATWGFEVTVYAGTSTTPRDLTGYSARMHMRRAYGDTNPTESFVCTIATPANGKIAGILTAAETALITPGKIRVSENTRSKADGGIYFYDLEIYTAGDALVDKIMAGKIYINPEVTKS